MNKNCRLRLKMLVCTAINGGMWSEKANLLICSKSVFNYPINHATEAQIDRYLNWLETHYQADRLTHYPVSSPLARQQIGQAISQIALGQ